MFPARCFMLRCNLHALCALCCALCRVLYCGCCAVLPLYAAAIVCGGNLAMHDVMRLAAPAPAAL